jgi:3',5'-cyclic AMP phosphodiesterase CpdA
MNQHEQPIILHISDLHRTPEDKIENLDLWNTLYDDIWYGYKNTNKVLTDKEPPLPDLPQDKIDIVIVSGDLTHEAATAEYDEVKDFLNHIVDSFLNKDRSRLVLVPGNHDVAWGSSEQAYEKVSDDSEYAKHVKQAFDHDGTYRLKDLTLWKRTQDTIYNYPSPTSFPTSIKLRFTNSPLTTRKSSSLSSMSSRKT